MTAELKKTMSSSVHYRRLTTAQESPCYNAFPHPLFLIRFSLSASYCSFPRPTSHNFISGTRTGHKSSRDQRQSNQPERTALAQRENMAVDEATRALAQVRKLPTLFSVTELSVHGRWQLLQEGVGYAARRTAGRPIEHD